jgi:Putative MetA-pathway of phenol degradation
MIESRLMSVRCVITTIAWTAFAVSAPATAAAQETINDVLSFLVTNRSIPTDDFIRDEQAAAATRDTIAGFFLMEQATLPISSSGGGFTYRVNPELGTVMRSSPSFGPFFTERSLTVGRGQSSFGLTYRSATFDNIDGRNLRDGTLVSTASILRGESEPFDIETVSLRIHTDTMTLAGNFGITDRLDLSAAMPFSRVTLTGQRVDTYRGRELIQATGSAVASGIGDLIVRAKYNVLRIEGSGIAIGGEARLPTGNEENLLGAGHATFKPRVIGSIEGDRVAMHGNVGYSFRDVSDELDYSVAVTVVAIPRLTVVGELGGRRLKSFGRLAEVIEPHPRLARVDTIRLTAVSQVTDRLVAVGGLKWNIAGTWILSANVLRPLTDTGLNARWIPSVTFDYSFGQ